MDSRNRVRAGWSPLLIAALGLCFAVPAHAQYMYLDSNGDGKHTDADVVDARDTTRVSIWLVLDRNRDGSPNHDSLNTGLQDYQVILEAVNGEVRWGAYVPDPTSLPFGRATLLDDSLHLILAGDFPSYGKFRPERTAKYRLGSVTAVVVRGTPSIRVAGRIPDYSGLISMYSLRYRSPVSYKTYWLGQVWKDTDGLAFGGRANGIPVLSAPAIFPVRGGTTATYRIEARDPDKDPITFRGVAPDYTDLPDWIRVRTIESGHGDAVGEVVVTADSCIEGVTVTLRLEASDGTWFDQKEVAISMERDTHPVPPNPMGLPRRPAAAPSARYLAVSDSKGLVGDWEWLGSPPSPGYFGRNMFAPGGGPIREGTRRRLVFGKDGSYERYVINSGKVRVVESGDYRFGVEREQWFLELGETRYSVWRHEPDTLGFLPFMSHDAGADYYVRVPSILRHGERLDTLRLVEPLGHPRIGSSGEVNLSAAMRNALRLYDREFRPYTVRDWPGPSNYEYGQTQIPWALIGDFDGDLIADAALYGRSGVNDVVVAILSGHGNVRALEVARRAPKKGAPQPFLELIARGTEYSPCWARNGSPEADAIGIVSPGVARFDYGLLKGEFVVYAPVP